MNIVDFIKEHTDGFAHDKKTPASGYTAKFCYLKPVYGIKGAIEVAKLIDRGKPQVLYFVGDEQFETVEELKDFVKKSDNG